MHRPCLVAIIVLAATPALAQTPPPAPAAQARIAEALAAAPAQVRPTATVVDLDGTVLREGTGAFTCMPAPDGFGGAMCLDAPWTAFIGGLTSGAPVEVDRLGIAYMMAGDSPTGGASNIDPADPMPTADNQWIVEGPHVMILAPEPMLAGLPTTPVADGPYVMWPGTPYAHVMLPVGARPEQRAISTPN
ncbi:hypothetical protein [Salinarimonas sp.]|uniref:hypothetical protein n=1 Tax=Salinarimonas sp. TaxID=2766526 RepID=UPI0032D93A52